MLSTFKDISIKYYYLMKRYIEIGLAARTYNNIIEYHYHKYINNDGIEKLAATEIYYKNQSINNIRNILIASECHENALFLLKKILDFSTYDECIICYNKNYLYKNNCERHSICLECYYQKVYIYNDDRCPCCRC